MPDIRHIVFDIGKVLLHYDPELPFSRLIPDAEERRRFFETVCTGAWNVEQDRGRSWQDAEALLIAEHPAHEDNIRNFRRQAFLLLYLLGASPAVCSTFVEGRQHELQSLAGRALYMPHGTSLRMGRLGYQSDAQASLAVSYNSLERYADSLHDALTRPWPAYEGLGIVNPGGEYIQLIYSSGPTGRPKGVLVSDEQQVWSVGAFGANFDVDSGSRSVVPIPYYHVAGGGWALVTLSLGGTVIQAREPTADSMLHQLTHYRATHSAMVPAVMGVLNQTPAAQSADFSALRQLVYGGSPISEPLLRASVRTFGARFVEFAAILQLGQGNTMLLAIFVA